MNKTIYIYFFASGHKNKNALSSRNETISGVYLHNLPNDQMEYRISGRLHNHKFSEHLSQPLGVEEQGRKDEIISLSSDHTSVMH